MLKLAQDILKRGILMTRWEKFKKSFHKNFLDFLMIFAAEDRFIRQHKKKSSVIKEQDRYGTDNQGSKDS